MGHTNPRIAVVVVTMVCLLLVPAPTAGAPADSPVTVDQCGTLDEPGTYVLGSNISVDTDADCLVVTADDVTLDGNGHTVADSFGNGSAVSAADQSNLTVRDLEITAWGSGVRLAGTSNVTLANLTVRNASGTVVPATEGSPGASDANDTTNTSTAVDRAGVHVTRSSDVRIDHTIVTDGVDHGIVIRNSSATTVYEGVVTDNNDGIRVVDSIGVTVTEAEVEDNDDDGVVVVDSNATLVDNSVSKNDDDGVYVMADGVTLRENEVTDNADDGIDLHDSTRAVVEANTVLHNSDDGVLVRGAVETEDAEDTDDGHLIRSNELVRNGDDGIEVTRSDGNTARMNNICWSGDHDITLDNAYDLTRGRNNCDQY